MPNNPEEINANIAAWFLKKAQEVQTTLDDRTKADTPVKTGYTQSQWELTQTIDKVGDTGRYENSAPAAVYLELGHSQQAPAGMVRINVVKIANEGL